MSRKLSQPLIDRIHPTEGSVHPSGEDETILRNALSSAGIGLLDWDILTDCIVVNSACASMLGYAVDDFPNTQAAFLALVHPSDQSRCDQAFQELLEQPTSRFDMEVRLHTKVGGWKWIHVIGSISAHNSAGTPVRFTATHVDISTNKQTDRILSTRVRLLQLSTTLSLDEFIQRSIDAVEELTDSRIGFFHLVDEDEQQLSLQAWSTKTLQDFCSVSRQGEHYSIGAAGVWTDCVKSRQTVIHNDYASLPNKKGLPEGHGTIVRELLTPLFRDGKIVAILGVGNKAFDYDEGDVRTIELMSIFVWNIFERKRIEEQLKHSEERFRSIVEHASDGIVISDESDRIVEVNQSLCEMLGYSHDELLTFTIHDLISTNEFVPQTASFDDLRSGKVLKIVCNMLRKDGSTFAADLQGKSISKGQFHTFIHDISERLAFEGRLRASEQEYRLLTVHASVGILVAQNHVLKFLNPYICDILGYTHEEGINHSYSEFIHPDDLSTVLKQHRRCMLKRPNPDRYSIRLVHKNGSLIWAQLSSVLIVWVDQPAILSFLTNINDLVNAQSEIRESKERLDLAMKSAELGIWDWNVVTNEVFRDARNWELTGYTPEEFQARFSLWRDIMHPDDREFRRELMHRTLRGELDSYTLDYRIQHKSGRWVWVNEHGRVFERDSDGNPLRMVGTRIDVTERIVAEEKLRESEERFKQVAEHSEEWIWEIDPTGLYTYSSIAVKNLLGYTPEEVVGKLHFYDLFEESTRETLARDRKVNCLGIVAPISISRSKSIQFDSYTSRKRR